MIFHCCYSLGSTSCVMSDFVRNFTFEKDHRVFYVKGSGEKYADKLSFIGIFSAIKEDKSFFHFHSVHFFWLSFLVWVFGQKSVLTIHTSWSNYSLLHKIMAILSVLFCSKIVFVSKASLDSFPVLLIKFFTSKICFINNAFDSDRVLPCKNKKNWVACGRIISTKRFDRSIDLFLQLSSPRDTLNIIGDGPLRKSLENEYRGYVESGRISFLGSLDRNKVYDSLAAASLFVSMSEVEGLPISVLEAMAADCFLFISKIPAHEPFSQCESVCVVGDKNTIENDFYRLASEGLLRRRSRDYVVDNFSVRNFTNAYFDVYRSIGFVADS